jgi:hypothetical protein
MEGQGGGEVQGVADTPPPKKMKRNSIVPRLINSQQRLLTTRATTQGCQKVGFQTKKPNLGKFWRALDWKMFIYFMPIWNNLWILGIFYDYLVNFVFIWYIFSGFGIMYREKSGNPCDQSKFMAQLNFVYLWRSINR